MEITDGKGRIWEFKLHNGDKNDCANESSDNRYVAQSDAID